MRASATLPGAGDAVEHALEEVEQPLGFVGRRLLAWRRVPPLAPVLHLAARHDRFGLVE